MGYENALHDESVSYYSSAFSLNEYQKLAFRTANGIDNPGDRLLNAMLGIAGELGELSQNLYHDTKVSRMNYPWEFVKLMTSLISLGEKAEEVKHRIFHKHPAGHKIRDPELGRKNRKEELGDILWYLTWLCSEDHLTLEEVAKSNIKKLQARYPEGFDPKRSINRKEALK